MYLGVTIDRGQLPTTSTADAAEWLENLGTEVQDGNYTDAVLNCGHTDIVSHFFSTFPTDPNFRLHHHDSNCFPLHCCSYLWTALSLNNVVVKLSIVLLVRMERVCKAHASGVVRLSSVAWLIGYILALGRSNRSLSGRFHEFRTGDFDVNPTLGILTMFTAMLRRSLFLTQSCKRFH